MNLATFEVEDVVIHDVPQPDPRFGPLVLTDAPVALDDDLRGYFGRKVVDSLSIRGVEVVADTTADATARESIAGVLTDARQLVAESRQLAAHLYGVQTLVNSPGLLAVVGGRIDGGRCVGILKLEREEGLRFSIHAERDGQTVIDVELLRDLTLTDRTRVFKTGLFVSGAAASGGVDPAHISGRVSDDQRGRLEGEGVATFFLHRFLGCALRVSPEIATRDFVRAAEQFFNEQVDNAERRAAYQVALMSRMQDNVSEVRPRTFAEENLDGQHRSAFLRTVEAAGLDPNVPFTKDTSLARVRGFKMVFESGMFLVGSLTDLDQRVNVTDDGAEISDAPKRLLGR